MMNTEEDRLDRETAKAFVRACAEGDVQGMDEAAHRLNEYCVDGWRRAFRGLSKLPQVPEEIRRAFKRIWIETKMLPLAVRDRRVLAKGLRLLMPCDYRGEPLRLYRGAGAFEQDQCIYGFCWTTDLQVARNFAEGRRQPDGSVVLRTDAPAEAVLWVGENVPGYYEESEVVVDPFKLRVEVVERLSGDGLPQYNA